MMKQKSDSIRVDYCRRYFFKPVLRSGRLQTQNRVSDPPCRKGRRTATGSTVEERRCCTFAGTRATARRRRYQSNLYVAVRKNEADRRDPLATKLGLTATAISLKSNPANPRQIAEESTTEVVNKIMERAGENVLVVGHSNSIPDVIKMLGGDVVPTIDERKFDDLFIVTVYAKGKAKVTHLKYGAE